MERSWVPVLPVPERSNQLTDERERGWPNDPGQPRPPHDPPGPPHDPPGPPHDPPGPPSPPRPPKDREVG